MDPGPIPVPFPESICGARACRSGRFGTAGRRGRGRDARGMPRRAEAAGGHRLSSRDGLTAMKPPGARPWPSPSRVAPPSCTVRVSRRKGRPATTFGRDAVIAGFPTGRVWARVVAGRRLWIEARPEAARARAADVEGAGGTRVERLPVPESGCRAACGALGAAGGAVAIRVGRRLESHSPIQIPIAPASRANATIATTIPR
jgi:hypothetical protein